MIDLVLSGLTIPQMDYSNRAKMISFSRATISLGITPFKIERYQISPITICTGMGMQRA